MELILFIMYLEEPLGQEVEGAVVSLLGEVGVGVEGLEEPLLGVVVVLVLELEEVLPVLVRYPMLVVGTVLLLQQIPVAAQMLLATPQQGRHTPPTLLHSTLTENLNHHLLPLIITITTIRLQHNLWNSTMQLIMLIR